jgi:hypothetical protein
VQILGDLIEMARVCAGQARLTTSQEVARALWKMACEYHARAQERASELKSGSVPDIGDPPPFMK